MKQAKIKTIKDWIRFNKPQFEMVSEHEAKRLSDGIIYSTTYCSKVKYQGYLATILEFMSDYVHVQIELDSLDSDRIILEVPINNISGRTIFVSPGVFTKEYDNSNPAPSFVK